MKLIGQKGPAQGSEWVIRGERLTVGRDPSSDIFVPDPKISRVHAEIVWRNGQYTIVDKQSTNGTFVDGMRITEGLLREGIVLKVGNSEIGVVPTESTDEFQWEDSAKTVSALVSVDTLHRQLEAFSPRDARDTQVDREIHDLDDKAKVETLTKLVDNLHTVYDLAEELSEVRSRDDLLDLILEKLLEVFPQLDRACILTRDETTGDFQPARMHFAREMIHSEFRISRSIFQRCVDERIGILATDAVADERFANADSIFNLQLRSCMSAPMMAKGSAIGGLYVDNPSVVAAFDRDDLELLTAFAQQAGMALNNALLYENIQRAYHQSILALINTIEAKDPYTMGHTQRTMRYAQGIGQEIGLSEPDMDRLRTAAQLHDIGKIGIREQLLVKGGALTTEEFDNIKAHVEIGVRILQPIDYLRDIIPIVRGHHEKFDGTGYPDGLSGEEIDLGARILALADAFDAMTTQRPYNKPFSFQQALERCRREAGKHFDPACVEALATFIERSMDGSSSGFSRKRSPSDSESTVVIR